MNVLFGSPHAKGAGFVALHEMEQVFEKNGISTEIVQVGNQARRGGMSSTFDELNKYFTICGMPVASGPYWNNLHGRNGEEAPEDKEGLQIMRTLAENMSFLMKSIALGKEQYGLPQKEAPVRTNFVR